MRKLYPRDKNTLRSTERPYMSVLIIPKGMKIAGISDKKIKDVEFLINMRPRKTLNYLNPFESLKGYRVSVIVDIPLHQALLLIYLHYECSNI